MGILMLNFLKGILIQNIRAEQVLPLLLATLQLFSWFAFCKTGLYAVLAVNGLHNHLYIILIFFGKCFRSLENVRLRRKDKQKTIVSISL
jgi:hypothetical protein